jgi:SPP1 family predicted phage head-tail adaptor
MTTAGDLREKVELQALVTVSDGAGGSTQSWETVLTASAGIKVLKAGEEIMQGRLASEQTLVVTLRWQPALADALTTWKLKNVRTGKLYGIKSITPDVRKAWVDILCQTDVL